MLCVRWWSFFSFFLTRQNGVVCVRTETADVVRELMGFLSLLFELEVF